MPRNICHVLRILACSACVQKATVSTTNLVQPRHPRYQIPLRWPLRPLLSWKHAPMRRFGPLIILAILFILAGVGATYYARLKQQFHNAPAPPKKLPEGTEGAASNWTYEDTRDGRNRVSIKAKDFKQVEGKMQLNGVELRLFTKDAKKYDLIKSASAEFSEKGNELYSDGDVEITMGVPADKPENEPPSGRLMSIKTSAVHFDSKSGKSYTHRPTTFEVHHREGECV